MQLKVHDKRQQPRLVYTVLYNVAQLASCAYVTVVLFYGTSIRVLTMNNARVSVGIEII